MIYHVPDDPEWGYFGPDEVYPVEGSGRRFALTPDDTLIEVEPADCNICEAPIPDDATVPLCRRCERTARAVGEDMAAQQRMEREYGS